jgi:hypothetical protein
MTLDQTIFRKAAASSAPFVVDALKSSATVMFTPSKDMFSFRRAVSRSASRHLACSPVVS